VKESIKSSGLGEHDATVKWEHEEGDGVVVVVMAVVVLVVVIFVVVIVVVVVLLVVVVVVVVVVGVVVVVVGTKGQEHLILDTMSSHLLGRSHISRDGSVAFLEIIAP